MRLPLLPSLLALSLPLAACDVLGGLLGPTAECTQDSDCSGDDLCVDGECVECENDRDCDDDEECDDGECESLGEGEGEGEGEGDPGEGEGEGDPGEGEGEGEGEPGCGSVPETGVCVGNTSRFCNPDTNTVEENNCSNYTPDLQCQQAFGLNMCAADTGDDCIVDGADGKIIAICADQGVGCKLGAGVTGVCEGGPGSCTASDENRCIGGDFILRCIPEIGYAWYADCEGRSGTCDNAQGACVLASGSSCLWDEGTGYADRCTPTGGGTPTTCPTSGVCP